MYYSGRGYRTGLDATTKLFVPFWLFQRESVNSAMVGATRGWHPYSTYPHECNVSEQEPDATGMVNGLINSQFRWRSNWSPTNVPLSGFRAMPVAPKLSCLLAIHISPVTRTSLKAGIAEALPYSLIICVHSGAQTNQADKFFMSSSSRKKNRGY